MSQQFSLFDDNLEPSPEPQEGAPPAAPAEGPSTAPLVGIAPALTPEEKTRLLDDLRKPALECTRCGLSRTRTHVVFGEGNAAAPLVFVGEGPGENEDA